MSLATLPARAASKLRTNWHRWRFRRVARRARELPPLPVGHLPFVMLSMVHTRDVDAYLVAAHSFARHVPPQRIVVVCDPSITDADRATLRASIPHVELVRAEDFRHPELPVGGCWERLQAMAHYAHSAYVVQLDADTVTTGPLPEVLECILNDIAFTTGERPGQTRVSHQQAKEEAERWLAEHDAHIQDVAELLLPEAVVSSRWYVRGCAGFFGVVRIDDLLAQILEFSREMRRLTGPRWNEWGTEQITANYVAARYERFRVLPYPKYGTPPRDQTLPALGHFMGSIRFDSDNYRKAAAGALRCLSTGVARQHG